MTSSPGSNPCGQLVVPAGPCGPVGPCGPSGPVGPVATLIVTVLAGVALPAPSAVAVRYPADPAKTRLPKAAARVKGPIDFINPMSCPIIRQPPSFFHLHRGVHILFQF